MQRAIRQSRNKSDMYNSLNESIKFVVSLGYDYDSVLDWNVGGFFYMMRSITEFTKKKYGAKK